MKNQSKRFYTTFENKDGDVIYLNKGFDEVIVNFVEIETTCLKCHSSFFSKSKLYKHIKTDCVEEAPLSSFTQLSLSIPIVMSKAIHQSFRLGFRFRSWTYATNLITFISKYLASYFNPDFTTCLNTSYGIILVDQDWLLKCLPHQKISTMSTLLKIKSIDTFKHESVEFAALSLYFPGKNNAVQLVYAALKYEIHLVERR